jgi:hypothetical protein
MNLFSDANKCCCSIWGCKEIQTMLFSDAVGLTIIVMQMNSLVGFGEVIETAHCTLVRLMVSNYFLVQLTD